MSFYCGCDTTTLEGGSDLDAVPAVLKSQLKNVCLGRRMVNVCLGAQQFLENGSQHYPNVDIFECPVCGRRMARE